MKSSQNFTTVSFPRVILLASLTFQLAPSVHQGSMKACAGPPVFDHRTLAGEASRAPHFSWRSTSSGPFLLYSEPIGDFSQTSALWDGELNESPLGRVSFLWILVLVFLGMMWHQESWDGIQLILFSIKYNTALGFGLKFTCWLFLLFCYWKASYSGPLFAI